jgi:LGFP repeat
MTTLIRANAVTDERQPVAADFSGAQGLQYGSGNVQYNMWLQERQLDAQKVEALNATSAASHVARLSAEDAAFVLAIAKPGPSAGVLKVLVTKPKYKNLATAIIRHINRAKAQELVAAVGPAAAELELLPDAVEAIAEYEDTGVPPLGEPTGELTLASESPQGTRGYYQNFEDGQIHWTVRAGAVPTRGANAVYHVRLGGSGGRLGFPLTPDSKAQRSPFGTDGTWQRFESEWNYPDEICERLALECGASVYLCDPYGAHSTCGGIGELHESEGGTGGWLGFPVSDEVEVGPSHRTRGGGTTGWCQHFEGGVVYYSTKTRAVPVPSRIADYHETRRHGVASSRGFPVSRVMDAAESRYGSTGQYQRFEGTEDYPQDIVEHWVDGETPGGATIYASDQHGTYCVGWGNGVLYERLGGTTSWLGFPKSDETDARTSPDEPWCTIQEFEGGAIFFKEEHGSVTVTRSVMDYLTGNNLRQRIGFPLTRENPLADGRDEPVQFFERGVVTVRKGMIEAWLRPDEPVPSS